MNMLQVVKMSDEVTVSSLPHPISMFFLGIFAVTITFMMIEVVRFRKDNEKMKSFMDTVFSKLEECKAESDTKISEISRKIDSRVDKALLTFKKQNKSLE